MESRSIKVLIIEDSPVDYKVISGMLEKGGAGFEVEWAENLSNGLNWLRKDEFDIIILDLALPESDGFETFSKVRTDAPHVPIILLTGTDDDVLALDLVRRGAQDYMVKGKVDADILARSIRYSIERQQMQAILQNLALIDELTGLYNRRGFSAIAGQHLKLANRTGRTMLLLYADLDNLKQINDSFGHPEGDSALIETAKILKNTFRESDITARYGGDEFVVLAIEAQTDSGKIISERLQKNLDAFNAEKKYKFELKLSTGMAIYNPETPRGIDELLTEADAKMYEHKRKKRGM